MKRVLISIIFLLLLINFVFAVSITSKATESLNDSETGNQEHVQTQNQGENSEIQTQNQEGCEQWTCIKWSNCHNNVRTRECSQVNTCPGDEGTPKLIKKCEEKEKLKLFNKTTECPFNCTCTGSATKCMLPGGERELTIYAGKSGNIIIQIKGVNMSTNVTLYKSDDGKVYGVFKGNKTKEVKLLPDQVQERIRERLKTKLQNEDITLNEDGTYDYKARERARLFAIIPVRLRVSAEINPETGEVIRLRKAWWAFMTRGEEEETVVGASCGTVTPGYNDECCQNKGYDIWNVETAECEFNA